MVSMIVTCGISQSHVLDPHSSGELGTRLVPQERLSRTSELTLQRGNGAYMFLGNIYIL